MSSMKSTCLTTFMQLHVPKNLLDQHLACKRSINVLQGQLCVPAGQLTGRGIEAPEASPDRSCLEASGCS